MVAAEIALFGVEILVTFRDDVGIIAGVVFLCIGVAVLAKPDYIPKDNFFTKPHFSIIMVLISSFIGFKMYRSWVQALSTSVFTVTMAFAIFVVVGVVIVNDREIRAKKHDSNSNQDDVKSDEETNEEPDAELGLVKGAI